MWVAYPFSSRSSLPDPGIEPGSPALQVGSLPTELSGKLGQTSTWHAWVTNFHFQSDTSLLCDIQQVTCPLWAPVRPVAFHMCPGEPPRVLQRVGVLCVCRYLCTPSIRAALLLTVPCKISLEERFLWIKRNTEKKWLDDLCRPFYDSVLFKNN